MAKKLLWVLMLWAGIAGAQEDNSLRPLEPQSVTLNESALEASYFFEAEAGSTWSFTAQAARFEVVDTVLRLYDPDGTLLLENDNESRDSTDARLEAWTAPSTGRYRVEVSREGEERGPTSGTAVLTAIPGYSSIAFSAEALSLTDTPVPVSSVAAPIDMRLTVENLNQGFELRSEAWQMQILPDRWQFQVSSDSVLNPILGDEVAFTAGEYHLEIQPSGVRVSLNDEMVITIAREIPLGTVSIAGTAVFSRALATIPFYLDETALPPVPPDERLYSAPTNPLAVMAELTELGYSVETGGLTLRVPRGLIETGNGGFSLYPLSTGNDVQNFVLSFEGRIIESGAGAACGMTFRQVDRENFATLMFSEDGSLYLLQYENGELLASRLAMQSVWVDPRENRANWVVLIVQEETATIYVNGRLAAQTAVEVKPGALQISVFLNEPVYTLCTLDNLWLWELE